MREEISSISPFPRAFERSRPILFTTLPHRLLLTGYGDIWNFQEIKSYGGFDFILIIGRRCVWIGSHWESWGWGVVSAICNKLCSTSTVIQKFKIPFFPRHHCSYKRFDSPYELRILYEFPKVCTFFITEKKNTGAKKSNFSRVLHLLTFKKSRFETIRYRLIENSQRKRKANSLLDHLLRLLILSCRHWHVASQIT